jgi:hypothetical protein
MLGRRAMIRNLKRVRDEIDPEGSSTFLCHREWGFWVKRILWMIEKHRTTDKYWSSWFTHNQQRIVAIDKVIAELESK